MADTRKLSQSDHEQRKMSVERYRCGLIVNPIAGMGGSVGLKGTDGPAVLAQARSRGARSMSQQRAIRALERLKRICPDTLILTGSGALGEDAARQAGFPVRLLTVAPSRPADTTNADDTKQLASALEAENVPLIMIAGGDGTVRDVFGILDDRIPILGIPTGVKMHSALFATSPELAGDVSAHYLSANPKAVLRQSEIMDVDEAATRRDKVVTHLFGYGRSPFERALVQGPKCSAMAGDEDELIASAHEIIEDMTADTIYLLGPGSTTRIIGRLLGVESTLLGVDAVCDRKIIGRDLSEHQVLELIADRPARIIVGVIGGQGCLFGRGNQQFSSDVIRQVGRDNIIVLAGMEKLTMLSPQRLFVDTGDATLDRGLAGYMHVHTGPGRRAIIRVGA